MNWLFRFVLSCRKALVKRLLHHNPYLYSSRSWNLKVRRCLPLSLVFNRGYHKQRNLCQFWDVYSLVADSGYTARVYRCYHGNNLPSVRKPGHSTETGMQSPHSKPHLQQWKGHGRSTKSRTTWIRFATVFSEQHLGECQIGSLICSLLAVTFPSLPHHSIESYTIKGQRMTLM